MTNKTPSAAYRGYGQPEAVFVTERMVDIIARALGLGSGRATPAEHAWACRVTLPLGLQEHAYDSGNYPEALRRALAALDYDGLRSGAS